jgi:hypothetical protein
MTWIDRLTSRIPVTAGLSPAHIAENSRRAATVYDMADDRTPFHGAAPGAPSCAQENLRRCPLSGAHQDQLSPKTSLIDPGSLNRDTRASE